MADLSGFGGAVSSGFASGVSSGFMKFDGNFAKEESKLTEKQDIIRKNLDDMRADFVNFSSVVVDDNSKRIALEVIETIDTCIAKMDNKVAAGKELLNSIAKVLNNPYTYGGSAGSSGTSGSTSSRTNMVM